MVCLGDAYFHRIKTKQNLSITYLVKFYISAFYLLSNLLWWNFCNFSLINTMMTKQQDTLDAEANVAGASYQGDNVKHLAIFFLQFFCSTINRPHRGNTLQDKMLGTKRFKAAFCFPVESPQKPKRPTTETILCKIQSPTTCLKPERNGK